MMSTTHAAMGVLLTVPLLRVAPELAAPAAVGAYVGGVFPDLDVAYGHRRTLHYPVYYWPLAVPAAVLAALLAEPVAVAVAAALCSAALHSVVDVVGGGLGLRPWLARDDRGVYLHHADRWLRPRRWVRYDGAPEDLALAAVCTAPAALAYEGPVRTLLLAGLAASAVYAAVRKRLPDVAPERFT